MKDQQRTLLAIALCVGIFLGWQLVFPPPASPPPAGPQAEQAVPAARGQKPLDESGPAAAAGALWSPPDLPAAATQPFATDWVDGEVSAQRAGLSRLDLRHFAAQHAGDRAAGDVPLSLGGLASAAGLQAQVQVQGQKEGAWQLLPATDEAVTLVSTTEADGWRLRLRLSPRRDAYGIDYELSAQNLRAQAQTLAWGLGLSLRKPVDQAPEPILPLRWLMGSASVSAQLTGVCRAADKTHRWDVAAMDKAPRSSTQAVRMAGIDRQYFVVAATAGPSQPAAQDSGEADLGSCAFAHHDDLVTLYVGAVPVQVAAGEQAVQRLTLYAGPKRDKQLQQVAAVLPEVVDYEVLGVPLGFLARPMVYVLGRLHQLTHSWGAAIALLTLVVKVLMFPVTYKSMIAMRRMQALKPQLDQLKETWAHDKERSQIEQMKLLRERGANPLGGCLPTLLQMPVWLALYRMLGSTVDLYRQPFLWLPDLTLPEPLPVLAVAVGALTFLQQKITPVSGDQPQAKMLMIVLPVLFTGLMFAMPSGLVVYILVNSTLTIFQQLAINRAPVS